MRNKKSFLYRHKVLLRGGTLLIIGVVFIQIGLPGPPDPGPNRVSYSTQQSKSFSFTVYTGEWYGNTTTIRSSYYAEYVEYMSCTYDFKQNGVSIQTVKIVLVAALGPKGTVSKSETIQLESGTYQVDFSYSLSDSLGGEISGTRTVSISITQSRLDGRTVDQILWDAFKIVSLAVTIFLFIGFYCNDLIGSDFTKSDLRKSEDTKYNLLKMKSALKISEKKPLTHGQSIELYCPHCGTPSKHSLDQISGTLLCPSCGKSII